MSKLELGYLLLHIRDHCIKIPSCQNESWNTTNFVPGLFPWLGGAAQAREKALGTKLEAQPFI